jgi:hypothetical protein
MDVFVLRRRQSMTHEDSLPELQLASDNQLDIRRAIAIINRLQITVGSHKDILEDVTKLHRLYHEFSMKEEGNGEFDQTLVSMLYKFVQLLPEQPNQSFTNGSGI